LPGEDILLEASHGDIAMWPPNRGEMAPDVSLGDTAVEYLLGEVAAVLIFRAESDVRRGVMCVMVSFCSNGLVTSWFPLSASVDPSDREDTGWLFAGPSSDTDMEPFPMNSVPDRTQETSCKRGKKYLSKNSPQIVRMFLCLQFPESV